MPLRIAGQFRPDALKGFVIRAEYSHPWMGWKGSSFDLTTTEPPATAVIKVPDAPLNPWHASFDGLQYDRTGASQPTTARYDLSIDVNPARWFSDYTGTIADQTGASRPSTATYTISREVPNSVWFSYAGNLNDLIGASRPSTALQAS